jgi:hypothetical protein
MMNIRTEGSGYRELNKKKLKSHYEEKSTDQIGKYIQL